MRGKWADPEFSAEVSELNPQDQRHAVRRLSRPRLEFPRDLQARPQGQSARRQQQHHPDDDPEKFKKAVHLESIHVDFGMQCVDCHFAQDAHGSGHIYGEVQAAIEITCADCHGTAHEICPICAPAVRPRRRAATICRCCAPPTAARASNGAATKLYQRSARLSRPRMGGDAGQGHGRSRQPQIQSARRARQADVAGHLDEMGAGRRRETELAHANDKMACFTCHLSWTTSCAGCHLPIEANWKTVRHQYEGGETRNFATYNPQVARDDMFQLGIAGTIKGNIIAPIASRSALVLSSTNINREPHLRAAAAGVRRQAIRARRSRRTTRIPSGAPRPRPAPTATSPSRTTTTRSWRSSCCSGPISSISSATTPGSARRTTSRRCASPNGTSRRR